MGKQFAKLAEFDKASVRIVTKIPLGERAQPLELRLVNPHEAEVIRSDVFAPCGVSLEFKDQTCMEFLYERGAKLNKRGVIHKAV